MAQDTSDYLRNAILDAIFNAGTVSVAVPYISLHTADPGTTGLNEVSGGGYARQSGSFGAAAAGSVSNDVQIQWTNMPATTVTYAGVWDAATVGNFLFRATITTAKTTNAGDTFQIDIGNITITEV